MIMSLMFMAIQSVGHGSADSPQELSTEEAGYVYMTCVGSQMENLARQTSSPAEEILQSARTSCAETETSVLALAANREAVTAKLAEVIALLARYGPESVARLRQRDRDWHRQTEGQNAEDQ